MPSLNRYALLKNKHSSRYKTTLLSSAILGASLVVATVAHADNETISAANSAKTSHWSGYVSATALTNMFKQSEPSSYQSVSANGRIGYRDTWGSVRLSVGGEVETHHDQSYYYDSFLEYRSPAKKLSQDWTFIGSAGVYLPSSHTSRKNKLYAAPRIAGYFFYHPTDEWSFYLSPRAKYNAYKYEMGRQGEHFVEHQIDILGDATWSFAENWYLDVNGSFGMSSKFNTARYDRKFTASEELGWVFSQGWVAAFGHNNSGGFYDPEQGPSHGFELYNKRSSVFYLSVTKYL
ncbi:hypothetical protein ACFOD0_11375 [Shewanella intestini]|uniref:Uncharacterized protein n=1 Tax=Shewanella intestini TaxID=2017544 RepID=A0ABS5I3W3_9GAMM|nr:MULTISPECIES: hypothetical protein [Shewanella]MBR9728384.1 hypothetical protein [Shewanella intestini]MRG36726.1 hypothetical protein [Shewanella sp. XMDDZSB0408]